MRPPLIPQSIPIHEQDSKLIKLLKSLYNALVEYREPKTGRIIVSLFMCLPSRKDFPEYFNIIAKPISMYEIRKRIENNVYTSEETCINDLKLMFNNCRTFNEDGSIIFEDSRRLEKIIHDKYNELAPTLGSGLSKPLSIAPKSSVNNIARPATPIKSNNNVHHDYHQTSTPNHQQNNNIRSNQHNHLIHHDRNNHNSIVNNNLISQSSNGFPSEDSNSNSNNFSASLMNEDSLSENPFHNDISMDSSSSLHDRPTKRLKRDHDLPKKRVLTGYIIYAAEVRKEYVDKNPNQDFGYISRLIGNDWKALPKDLKQKYEQRAMQQNAQMAAKEAARLEQIRASTPTTTITLTGSSTPLATSKKHKFGHALMSGKFKPISTTTNSQYIQTRPPPTFTEAGTQTTPARFVEPPKRIKHNYMEIYRRFLGEDLDITPENRHHLQHLDADSAERWLGAGIGRHKSSADALWALRDFMLQDAETMRFSLQPYQLTESDLAQAQMQQHQQRTAKATAASKPAPEQAQKLAQGLEQTIDATSSQEQAQAPVQAPPVTISKVTAEMPREALTQASAEVPADAQVPACLAEPVLALARATVLEPVPPPQLAAVPPQETPVPEIQHSLQIEQKEGA